MFKKIVSMITLALVLALSFGTTVFASSENTAVFDFGATLLDMDAGTTKDVWVISHYDYSYYVGPHTSAATYMECTMKEGTETVRLHIGADETVKNIFFHFYVDDPREGSKDVHDCIEVYVHNIDPVAEANVAADNAAKLALKNFSGNTKEFNALYYYYNYKDLQDAFGMDPARLLQHWNEFGKNEHRIANRFK